MREYTDDGREIVTMRVPSSGELVTVNPDPAMRTMVPLTIDDQGKYRLVPDDDATTPSEHIRWSMVFLAQGIDGELFLWPIMMPVPSNHAVYAAMKGWISLRTIH